MKEKVKSNELELEVNEFEEEIIDESSSSRGVLDLLPDRDEDEDCNEMIQQMNVPGSQIPGVFSKMDNVLEICNWLTKHPRILQLTNQMLAASSLSLDRADSFNGSTSSDTSMLTNLTDNRVLFIFSKNFIENLIKIHYLLG